MAGISSKAAGGMQNRKKFNDGTELENGEFTDGSGLDLYATEFRSYDPQIGRFHQIDALADDYYEWSPFAFAFNNPISYNDPLGLAAQDSIKAPDGQMVVDNGSMPEVVVTATVKKNTSNNSNTTTVKPVGDPVAHWNPKVVEGRTVSKGDGNILGVVAGVVMVGRSGVTPQHVLLTGGFLLAAGFYLSAVNPPGSLSPVHYSGSPDNTFVTQPPYIFKAEDKTDYLQGGGQAKRDADIKRYPKPFQRWYHREYKPKVNPGRNATPEEIKEAYQDWLDEGQPEAN